METSAWLWKTACVNVSYELNLRTGKEWSINYSCWFSEQDQEIHWKDYTHNLNIGWVIASDSVIFVFFAHKKVILQKAWIIVIPLKFQLLSNKGAKMAMK